MTLSGCFREHGLGDDAGSPRLDASRDGAPTTCEPLRPLGTTLTCPPGTVAASQPVRVLLETTHQGCCSSGALRVTPRSTSRFEHELLLGGEVCECCEGCLCLGPTLTEEVDLGTLPVGEHTIRAGDARCVVVVDERSCEPMALDTLLAPSVLFPGQELAFTASSERTSCSCEPTLVPSDTGFDAQLCNCCHECECVDPPYEVAYQGRDRLDGFDLNGERHEVALRALDACPAVAGSFEIVPPAENVRRFGPALHWVHFRGQSRYAECCGPLAGIMLEATSPTRWSIELRDCTSPCRCAGPPAMLDAWLPLGELAPGEYIVVAPTESRAFSVP